jgi:hypothetical protein
MSIIFLCIGVFIYLLIGGGVYAAERDLELPEEHKRLRFIHLLLLWPFELGKAITGASLYHLTHNITPLNNTPQYHLSNISKYLPIKMDALEKRICNIEDMIKQLTIKHQK